MKKPTSAPVTELSNARHDSARRFLHAVLKYKSVGGGLNDLSARQLGVLCHVLDGSAVEVRHLATTLRVNKPGITRAIDRLEEHGLARRVPQASDRRSPKIEPTAAGRKLWVALLAQL